MNHVLISTLRIVLLAVVFSAPTVDVVAEIKIGAVASLTGNASKNGKNWLEGARLATDELQAEGVPVRLIVEDDATLPSQATAAFTKLATVDKVYGIIGGTWDFLGEAIYPLAERYKIPVLTPTNPIEGISASALRNPYVFTNSLSVRAEGERVAKFLVSQAVKKVAVVYVNVPYGTVHQAMMVRICKEQGIEVSGEFPITMEGFKDDARAAALRISRNPPDLVFLIQSYEGVDVTMREFERLGVTPKVLTTYTLAEALDFSRAPERYENAFGIFPQLPNTDFVKRYEKRYGYGPYAYGGAGYDAVRFLVKAKLAGDSKAGNVLPEVTYEGVTGSHVFRSDSREIADGKAIIVHARNGQIAEVPE